MLFTVIPCMIESLLRATATLFNTLTQLVYNDHSSFVTITKKVSESIVISSYEKKLAIYILHKDINMMLYTKLIRLAPLCCAFTQLSLNITQPGPVRATVTQRETVAPSTIRLSCRRSISLILLFWTFCFCLWGGLHSNACCSVGAMAARYSRGSSVKVYQALNLKVQGLV